MIDLYSWPTPNGQKVHVMLEETALPYEPHPVNIGAGEQFQPAFLEISPNNKIPAIVDRDGPDGRPISVFESGAILLYLAEKSGLLLGSDTRRRYAAIEWLMFQVGGVGPMFGQLGHFVHYAPEKIPYAIERYSNEVARLYRVLDGRLRESRFLGGDDYSVADVAVFPWVRSQSGAGAKLDEVPSVKRWFDEIAQRPAVQRGLRVMADRQRQGPLDEKAREVLFGKAQYATR